MQYRVRPNNRHVQHSRCCSCGRWFGRDPSGARAVHRFAPNDDAFAQLPEGLVAALLEEENRDTLVKILTCHVIGSKVMAADVTSCDCPTVEGSAIDIQAGDNVVLNKTTKVIGTDIMASNGVIHVIDSVLLPEGVDAAALLS